MTDRIDSRYWDANWQSLRYPVQDLTGQRCQATAANAALASLHAEFKTGSQQDQTLLLVKLAMCLPVALEDLADWQVAARHADPRQAEFWRIESWRRYRQDQPRIPAGQTGGGEWTSAADKVSPELNVANDERRTEHDPIEHVATELPELKPVQIAGNAPILRCQNVNCGAPMGGAFFPLCQFCNERLKNGDGPYMLENGRRIFVPITPDGK